VSTAGALGGGECPGPGHGNTPEKVLKSATKCLESTKNADSSAARGFSRRVVRSGHQKGSPGSWSNFQRSVVEKRENMVMIKATAQKA